MRHRGACLAIVIGLQRRLDEHEQQRRREPVLRGHRAGQFIEHAAGHLARVAQAAQRVGGFLRQLELEIEIDEQATQRPIGGRRARGLDLGAQLLGAACGRLPGLA